jgi:phage-related protein
LLWVGGALGRLRAFPAEARREAGHQLHRLQLGLEPSDWKPMPAVGPGVVEIRVHAGGEYRLMYVANRAEGIYVLHAFEKRTEQTRKGDIEIGRKNLAAGLKQRLE